MFFQGKPKTERLGRLYTWKGLVTSNHAWESSFQVVNMIRRETREAYYEARKAHILKAGKGETDLLFLKGVEVL